MNLLIDSGNSYIKWACSTVNSFVVEGRCLSTEVSRLHGIWQVYDRPVRVVVANVAGTGTASEISRVVDTLWQLDAEFIVSIQKCCGLTNSYHQPDQLGIDRWMAMVAAYQMTKCPVTVIDCGTAITIDRVDKNGVFVGGVIMPGLNTAFKSLRAETDVVDETSIISNDVSALSQSTQEGVVAGVIFGLAGGIERVLKEQSGLVGKTPKLILTGGDAEQLMPFLNVPAEYQASLVLQGLRIVAVNGKV